MKKFGLLLLMVTLSSCQKNESEEINLTNPFSDNFLQYIQMSNTTWEPGINFQGEYNMTLAHYLTGELPDTDLFLPPPLNKSEQDLKNYEPLPAMFDAREKWFFCPTIGRIRDQGSCGSCWAMATVNAMTDRICIHSEGESETELSVQHVLSCCGSMCGFGCRGGYTSAAFSMWVTNGIVTGGDYNCTLGCKPYTIEPCTYNVNGKRRLCQPKQTTPNCSNTCIDQYDIPFNKDLNYGKKFYSVEKDESEIRREIFNSGPVTASFTVYKDFLLYKKGVYQHVVGDLIGGHAIRLIGWGEENNVPYWLVANSWSKHWGDDGLFKILRGKNHCNIEGKVVTGIPKYDETNIDDTIY